MPNWVYNTMNVSGDPEDVRTFVGEMATPIPSHIYPEGGYIAKDGEWKMEEVTFSFWNVIAPTDLKSYFTGETWYNWNCANWGVKWDAKMNMDELEISDHADGCSSVSYSFDTAWGTPTEVFQALTKKYPHLEFSIEFEEEQGWGGEYLGSDGELSLINEYDIPNSHKEYDERDRLDSCLCAYETDPENMYTDCPERIEFESDPNRLISVTDLTSLVG